MLCHAWRSCSTFLPLATANTSISMSGRDRSGEKRWWVFLLVDRLFADEQREEEAVRRAELLNDGLVCLVWLQPSRVQASFVHCWPGHSYWKHPRPFVLISAQLSHTFFFTVQFSRSLLQYTSPDLLPVLYASITGYASVLLCKYLLLHWVCIIALVLILFGIQSLRGQWKTWFFISLYKLS